MSKAYEPINIYCASCGAPARFDIARQVYRCAYCGGETGIEEPLAEKQGFRQAHRARMEAKGRQFPLQRAQCAGCGAEVIFPQGEMLTGCAFCGRNMVRKEYLGVAGFPEILIPFKITEDQARANLLAWCERNRGKREARDIKQHLDQLRGFYLPYELVKGPTRCDVSRQDSRTYRCRGFWEGSFVNTSRQLDNLLLDGMEPYDLSDVKEFDFSYLAGQRVKVRDTDEGETLRRVSDEIASRYRPFASKVLETKGVAIRADTGHMVELSAVLPVYYLRVGDTLAAVNGQTGKVAIRERKDRYLMPWWIRPILGSLLFPALAYGIMAFFGVEPMGRLMVAGMLCIFLLFVLFTAYHNQYGGLGRERLPRRVFTWENSRDRGTTPVATPIAPPEFYMPIDGRDRAVELSFTTPLRMLNMGLLAFCVVFLPYILAFFFNGCSFRGFTMGGGAVWLCVMVPLAPVFLIKYGRLELYEHPIVRYRDDDGRQKRFRVGKTPWKEWLDTVKVFVFSPFILVILFLAVALIVGVILILHWDSF